MFRLLTYSIFFFFFTYNYLFYTKAFYLGQNYIVLKKKTKNTHKMCVLKNKKIRIFNYKSEIRNIKVYKIDVFISYILMT